MQQFDLSVWLQDKSRKVVTRRGNPVRIICTDRKHGEDDLPIVFLEQCHNGEFLLTCRNDGRCDNYDTQYDLFFADEEELIGSLPEESASEDLEEYYKKEFLPNEWFAKPGQRTISQFNFFTAKHFAEWQKQQMKEVLQTEYEKGRFDMREEMMKDSVHAWVNTYESVTNPYDNRVSFITILSPSKFKNKETVQIIIVKED